MTQEIDQIIEKYEGQYPVPVVSIANDLGIQVFETKSFDDSKSGSIEKSDDKFVIYVNATHPATRKRFTIAHEIGHFIKHPSLFSKDDEHIDEIKRPLVFANRQKPQTPAEIKREKEADIYAANLLMPKKEFENVWKKSHSIEDVAEYFNVSESAATIRASVLMKSVIF